MPEDPDELSPEHRSLPNDVQAELRIKRKLEREALERDTREHDLQVENAILRAGVPEHPAREAVFAAYDGSLEAEPIRAYAEKMGIMATVTHSTPTAEELAAGARIAGAGTGAPPPGSNDVDLAAALKATRAMPDELGYKKVLEIIGEMSGKQGFTNRDGMIGELGTDVV